MAQTIKDYGTGGQRWAEEKLQWNRGTIRKGQQELSSGIPAVEDFSNRGRRKVEEHLPNLLTDIKAIVEPKCQTDPTFHTTRLYRPMLIAFLSWLKFPDYFKQAKKFSIYFEQKEEIDLLQLIYMGFLRHEQESLNNY